MSYFKNFFLKKFHIKFYCFFGLSILTFSNSKLASISDVMPDADLKNSIELIERKGFMLMGLQNPDPDPAKTPDELMWTKMNAALGIQPPHATKNVAANLQYKLSLTKDTDGKPVFFSVNRKSPSFAGGGDLAIGNFNNQRFMEVLFAFHSGVLDVDTSSEDDSFVFTKIHPDMPTDENNQHIEIVFKGSHGNTPLYSIGHSAKSISVLDRNTVIIISSTAGIAGFHIWENANGFTAGESAGVRNILTEKGRFKSVSISSNKIIFSVKIDGKIAVYGLDGSDKTQELIPNIADVNNNTFKKICFKGDTAGEYSMVALTEDGRIFTASSRRPNKNLTDEGLSNIWDASIRKDGLLMLSMPAQNSSELQKTYGGRIYIGRISFAPSEPETAVLGRNSGYIDGLRSIRSALESGPDFIRILDCSAKVAAIDFRSYPDATIFRDFYGTPKGKENGKVMVLRSMANDGNLIELIASPEHKGVVLGGADVFGADPNFNSYDIDCGNDGSYAWLRINEGTAFLRNGVGNVVELLGQYNPIKLRRISISDENTVIGVGFDNFVYQMVNRDAKSWQKVDKAGEVKDASVVKQKTSDVITLMIVDSIGDVKKINGSVKTINGVVQYSYGDPEAVTLDYSPKDNTFERGLKFNTISASTLSGGNGLYFAARNDAHRIFEEKDGKLTGPLLTKAGEPICFTNSVKTAENRTLIFNIWADGGKDSEFAAESNTPQEIINRINEETTWKSGATFIRGPEQPNVLKDEDLKESIKSLEERGFALLGSPDPDQTNKNPESSWIEMNKLLGIPTPDPAKNIAAHFQYKIAISMGADGKPMFLKINKDGIPFGGGGTLFEGKLSNQPFIENLRGLFGDVLEVDFGADDCFVYSKLNPGFNTGIDGYKKEIFFKQFGQEPVVSIGNNAISLSLADKNNFICISTNPNVDDGFWLLENTNGFSTKNEAGAYSGHVQYILKEKGKFKWVSMSTDKNLFSIKSDGKIVVYSLDGTDKTQTYIPNASTINGVATNIFKKIVIKGETTGIYSLLALTEDGRVFTANSNNKNLTDSGISNIFDASIAKDGTLMVSFFMQKTSRQQRVWGGRTYTGRLFPAPTVPRESEVTPMPEVKITPPPPSTSLTTTPSFEQNQTSSTAGAGNTTTPIPHEPPPPPTNPLVGNDATAMGNKLTELKTSRFDGKTETEQVAFFIEIKGNIANINTVLGENNENWNTMYNRYQDLQPFHTELIE